MEFDFQVFPEVSSTSETARELAKCGCPEGTVVIADIQRCGRGRGGSEWLSRPGGLYMTAVLRPAFPLARAPWLSLAGAISAAEAISSLTRSPGVRLKWPNDVLLNGKKLGGILGEAGEGSDGPFVLMGIGINLDQDRHHLPLRPLFPATSLKLETGRGVDRMELAREIAARLRTWYERVGRGEAVRLSHRFAELSAHYRHRLLLEADSRQFEAEDRGISERGGLLIAYEGRVEEFVSGQILKIFELNRAMPTTGLGV